MADPLAGAPWWCNHGGLGVAVPVAAPMPPAAKCETHIWPAARVAAVTQGAGSMFGLIGGLIDAAANANRSQRD